MTTVICLDDFHSNDRAGRKVSGKSHHIPTGGVDKRGKAGREVVRVGCVLNG